MWRHIRKILKRSSLLPEGTLIAKHISNEEIKGYRISSPTMQIASDINSSANTFTTTTGRSPRGEEGSGLVSQNLINFLNQSSEEWKSPTRPQKETGIDWTAKHKSSNSLLQIQVTRVNLSWKELTRDGSMTQSFSLAERTSHLYEAICKKEALANKEEITLAIDALSSPFHATIEVRENFLQQHKVKVKLFGFESIWVVGPDTVLRLDE